MACLVPTPVSALVHSSTLVVAGVVLLYKVGAGLACTWLRVPLFALTCVSLLTSGLLSLVELDYKKVVALSTLHQVAIMLLLFALGLGLLGWLHLTLHALFKSLLFLTVGALIHTLHSSQEGRVYADHGAPLHSLSTLVAVLSLTGALFLCGYYSKEASLTATLGTLSVLFLHLGLFTLLTFTLMYTYTLLVLLGVIRLPLFTVLGLHVPG